MSRSESSSVSLATFSALHGVSFHISRIDGDLPPQPGLPRTTCLLPAVRRHRRPTCFNVISTTRCRERSTSLASPSPFPRVTRRASSCDQGMQLAATSFAPTTSPRLCPTKHQNTKHQTRKREHHASPLPPTMQLSACSAPAAPSLAAFREPQQPPPSTSRESGRGR